MTTQPLTSPFSLTYGEETKLPLTVRAAAFHVTAAISQQIALVEAHLTVCNDSITKDIEATLRFPLPDSDATVCGFSVGADRAIAVPKAKAAEVAYKEREKGRAVATATKVSGAMWETTVYPLPYNQTVEVTVHFVCNMTADGAVALPLVFAAPVERITVSALDEDGAVGVDNLGGGATGSTMPDGLLVTFAPVATEGRIVSAERNGSLYWSGRVPKAALDRAFAAEQATATPAAATTNEANEAHVGIIVDTSRSCAPMAEARLACLAALDASYAACGRRVRFTVWSLSRRASCLGERMEAAAARAVLVAVRYDGGTNLSLLGGEGGLLDEAGPRGKGCDEGALQLTQPSPPPDPRPQPDPRPRHLPSPESSPSPPPTSSPSSFTPAPIFTLPSTLALCRCEAVVLLTDGVNNLLAKQMPDLGAAGVAAVPLHVPLPPTGLNANLALLRWLAYQTGGSAATRLDDPRAFADAVSGAAAQTVRTRRAPPPPPSAPSAPAALVVPSARLHPSARPSARPSAHPSARPSACPSARPLTPSDPIHPTLCADAHPPDDRPLA